MPFIPKYQADLQQQLDSPVRVSDTDIARVQGAAIADFGKGLFDVGQTMLAQERIRKKTQNQIELANWTNYSEQAADTAENSAYLNAKEDGSDLSTLFEKEYDKAITEGLKQKKNVDPDLYFLLQNQSGEIRNRSRGNLLKAQREAFLKYADRSFADIKNQASARIIKNPLNYNDEFQKYSTLINNSALTPPMKQKAILDARRDFADSAVQSFQENERWDEAKQAVTGPFGVVYSSEDQIKKLDEIESQRLKVADRRMKEDDKAEKNRKEALKITNTKFFRTRMDEANEVLNIDGAQDDTKIMATRDFMEKVRADVANGDLTETQGNFLTDLLNKSEKKEMAYNAIPYWNRVAAGKDLDKISQDVTDNVRDLDPGVATQLLRAIDVEKDRQKKKGKGKGNNKILMSAFNSIKEQVPKDPTGGFLSVDDGTTYRAAETEFWKQYYSVPKWQNDPQALADQVIEKYYWKTSKPSMLNRLQNFDDPKKAASHIEKLLRTEKINKQEALDMMRELKVRSQREKDLQRRKNGVK